ncbi:MAG: LytTR family DNA-binding domain-containing protein [Defluviitaleaceae bacterium]|nr:LytTR family DNA-binding domain-containing protein [Defluviitaleaceae bacterium]
MLSIFICEDDIKQRERLKKIVDNYIMIEELDMEVALETENPCDVLDYLDENPKKMGLYFLDVDLQHKINGIALASKIRERDDLGKIVFVTTHSELSYLTFVHKIEALDYIIKDKPEEIQRRVCDCIQIANKRHLNDKNPDKKIYTVKIEDRVLAVPYEEVMFIESSDVPHKLVLHLDNGQLEYYGSLKEVEQAIPDFYRCHKSVVVNPNNIKEIDKSTKEAEMVNGEYCLISARAMKGLLKIVEKV